MQPCLMIEDDETNREILLKMLEPAGYAVESYTEAQPALDYCRRHRPCFILLDYYMKDMNGLEFLKELRKIDPHAEIPVIMCTGENKKEHFRELYVQGIAGYLLKPFTENELYKQLKELNLYPPVAEPAARPR
jgi:CheY-like chemotaxis protein